MIADTYRAIGVDPSVGQRALAKLCVGEPLTSADEARIALECTGRTDFPEKGFQEISGYIGRKGGKTEYVIAPIIVHRACTDRDAPGTYLIVGPSKSDQARLAWNAVNRQTQRGFPNLIADVKESEGRIFLHNGNDIKIASANFRYLRAPKYKVGAIDEGCFFVSDDADIGLANPLEYILDSIAGGMVATENPLLLILSSPWNRSGILFEHFRDRGANPDRLFWQAPTLVMNPTANVVLMERHRRDRGEAFYSREYLAIPSEDAISYIEADDVDAAIADVPFFPPKPGVLYCMGLDPGRKRDHFGSAIAHRDGETVVVDWCREWKPGLFGLKYASVLPEIWAKAREYNRIRKIASDQVDFGGIEASIPLVNGRPEFEMERVMTGGNSGAELADTTRALFANRRLILPNQPGLADEFKRLADYLAQGGARDVRAKRGFDDRSRAIMLAVHQAWLQPAKRAPIITTVSLDGPTTGLRDDDPGPERWWSPGGGGRGMPSFGGPRRG